MTTIDVPPSPEGFYETLGKFHALWQTLDFIIDYAIGRLSGLDYRETIECTRGLTHGTKLEKLTGLVVATNLPAAGAARQAIKKLDASRRNAITHSYLDTEIDRVVFIYNGRKAALSYSLSFTGPDFVEHVAKLALASQQLQNALGFSNSDIDQFGLFAINAAPVRY